MPTLLSGFTATSQVAAEQALANQIINEWLNGSGRQETCGTVNQDLRESRAEIELLDTLSSLLKFAYGLSDFAV